MNKEEARQFKARWRAVNDETARETREATPTSKLQQLALMYEAGQALGWTEERETEIEMVRERWRRLQEFYSIKAPASSPTDR
jgi:hypothetical protein